MIALVLLRNLVLLLFYYLFFGGTDVVTADPQATIAGKKRSSVAGKSTHRDKTTIVIVYTILVIDACASEQTAPAAKKQHSRSVQGKFWLCFIPSIAMSFGHRCCYSPSLVIPYIF